MHITGVNVNVSTKVCAANLVWTIIRLIGLHYIKEMKTKLYSFFIPRSWHFARRPHCFSTTEQEPIFTIAFIHTFYNWTEIQYGNWIECVCVQHTVHLNVTLDNHYNRKSYYGCVCYRFDMYVNSNIESILTDLI